MSTTNNYTLGRGKVYFSRFATGTTNPEGYRHVGNTPSFAINTTVETLDHYNSDEGVREKDSSVVTEVNRSAQLTCDNIDWENMGLFFMSSKTSQTTTAATGLSENFSSVEKGKFYPIGVTDSNPVGVRGVENVAVVSDPSGTNYVSGTDFIVDEKRGIIEILESGSITNGANITVNYDVKSSTQDVLRSGSQPVEGSIRFLENNPVGDNRDMLIPRVRITPDGDYELKGDEEWRKMSFSLEILDPVGAKSAVYINGQPV